MELVELHVREFRSGLEGESDSIAGGDGRIRGVAIDLAGTAGGDENGTGEHDLLRAAGGALVASGREFSTDHLAILKEKTADHGPLSKADARMGVGLNDERSADLRAGGISIGVENAGARMRSFARAKEFAGVAIKACAPFDEFGDAVGALVDEDFGSGLEDEAVAGGESVAEMQSSIVSVFPGSHRDAALRVEGVRFAERLLGDDEDVALLCELNCGAQTGDARTHHDEVGRGRKCHQFEAIICLAGLKLALTTQRAWQREPCF